MRLQARLAVATAAVLVPLVLGLTWLDARAKHRAATDQLIELLQRRSQAPTARARCEADPVAYGGPLGPRPPDGRPADRPADRPDPGHDGPPRPLPFPPFPPATIRVYDDQGRPAEASAPALPAGLVDGLGDDGVAALRGVWPGSKVRVLVRTPWATGPCAYLLGDGTTAPGWRAAILPASRWWLLPSLAVIVVVLLAVWPVVRRLRRLTRAVERSAADGFGSPIAIDGALDGQDHGNDEVAALARAFAAAAREVAAQLAAKDQRERALRDFLANTTHDVAIPLTVLQGRLATMRRAQVAGEPVPAELVSHAIEDAHHLGALIHNLGAAAKLEAGEPEIVRAPVDLGGVVRRCVARHQPLSDLLGVDLQAAVPEAPLFTLGDVTLLEEAIGNVIYNAIHYNERGGHVAVVLDPLPPGRYSLAVADDGPGLAPGEAAHLFERAFRGQGARARKPAGRGLGLDIAKRVADTHAMTLTAEEPEEGGLRISFEGAVAAP